MDKTRQQTLLRWLRAQQAPGRRWSNLGVLCGTLAGALLLLQAWWLADILHRLIIDQVPRATLWPLFTGLLGLMLLRGLLGWGREYCAYAAGAAIRKQIRSQLLAEMTRRGPAFLQQKPAGSWASLLQEQTENLHDFYARYLPQTRLSGIQPLLILIAVFPVNWAAGLILAVTAPLIPLFMILTGLGAADANRRNFAALRRLSGHFLDRLRGMDTLRHYQRTGAEAKAIADASEDFRERTMEVLRMAFLSSAVLEFFASVAIAVVAVYFGFTYLEHLNFGGYGSKATLFTGLFVLLLAPDFYLPLRELGTHYHAKAQAIGAADEIEQFLAEPLLAVESGPQQPAFADAPTLIAQDLEVLSPQGTVLVGPLSFTLAAQTCTALVGRSGAGKSSLLGALLGFLPYRGSLTIDGHELRSLDLAYWRRQLGWLGQNPRLLAGSLRENLQLADHFTDAELELAMHQAGAADILASRGWDHPVGDGSSGLSVGQAQRVALARTLLRRARFWLLDEPTASVDRDNEARILAALQPVLRGATSLLVTHRLDQLEGVDQILMLQQGQLVAAGAPANLKRHSVVFRQLLGHEHAAGTSVDPTAEIPAPLQDKESRDA